MFFSVEKWLVLIFSQCLFLSIKSDLLSLSNATVRGTRDTPRGGLLIILQDKTRRNEISELYLLNNNAENIYANPIEIKQQRNWLSISPGEDHRPHTYAVFCPREDWRGKIYDVTLPMAAEWSLRNSREPYYNARMKSSSLYWQARSHSHDCIMSWARTRLATHIYNKQHNTIQFVQ